MDPSLARELLQFKKKSISLPVVEASRKSQKPPKEKNAVKPAVHRSDRALPPQLLQKSKRSTSGTYDMRSPVLKTKNRFSILASIVDFMRKRYQGGENSPLTLDEVLDFTNNTDINIADRMWLTEEALGSNKKLSMSDGKLIFKPVYNVRDKKSLHRLLEQHANEGEGGILLDEIRESLPNADDVVKALRERIMFVTRPNDKKAILFLHESQYCNTIDEDFKKLWRTVAVEGLGDADIERYLQNVGITTLQGASRAQSAPDPKQKKSGSKKRPTKMHNTHLSDNLLKDYSASSK